MRISETVLTVTRSECDGVVKFTLQHGDAELERVASGRMMKQYLRGQAAAEREVLGWLLRDYSRELR